MSDDNVIPITRGRDQEDELFWDAYLEARRRELLGSYLTDSLDVPRTLFVGPKNYELLKESLGAPPEYPSKQSIERMYRIAAGLPLLELVKK